MSGVEEFVERLGAFLEALPRNFRYAVEIRNPEYLALPYFACLAQFNVAHVYNAWTRMPKHRSTSPCPARAPPISWSAARC